MSARDRTLIADWEARLRDNALALRILSTLKDRKSEVERCALDGLQRENPQFARAATRRPSAPSNSPGAIARLCILATST